MLCLCLVIITICLIIASILFFPTVKIGNHQVSCYWVISLISAGILFLFRQTTWENIWGSFTANTSMNPLKILVLFICMTILSIFLDEIGFFRYIAVASANKLKGSQIKLFFGFYALISILTIFTSNDIIILTFTPFICYYAKNTKINPIPYLVLEFVAANTWSMALIIGNPTNIYLASALHIDFLSYLRIMILPTIIAASISLFLLFLMFRKNLKKPMEEFREEIKKPNLVLLIIGLVHLFGATVLLAIASYIQFEMWIIALSFAGSLLLITTLYLVTRKERITPIQFTLLRAPWSLIPFVLSMFVLVLSLNQQGITKIIEDLLLKLPPIFSYGIGGTITANLINNIPMSVFFSNLLTSAPSTAIYASIIASNIAAFITPIGALAGIMWMKLLKTYDIKFSFKDFSFYGCIIGIPSLLGALAVLYLF
ncbi:MAG: SLC13 family permease [Roseburia sp.]|nr:SLC13 family permease [Anaeroplasma bactoclasticum]MCM1195836.1 SLC13 family permease [Roseburia sp.]MCM1556307.1 SLC13 family permease [Anaeroplasma bactoclasticum]